ncbi:MAG: phosphatidylserine decarboxylase [Bryobacterales bacterium]|nr:phosphatidylserine decarboxylase [Bryobacterales bacterium]
MVKDGILLAAAFTAAGLAIGEFLDPRFGLPLFVVAAFFLFFFRDPERKIAEGDVVVSPADGSVAMIEPFGTDQQRISIFLSVFDVHVNRSPIAGRITAVDYRKGKFVNAMRADASDENERNVVEVQADDGSTVTFSQIAGLLARRIVFRPKVGDRVEKGQRVGMIKFGSRVDIFLGPEWEILVQPDDVVAGGSSILARRSAMILAGRNRGSRNETEAEAEL